MKNFYKENLIITYLLICSFIINVLYIATNHLPEKFTNADLWFDFSRQIGLAIIASFIFYIFTEHIPTKEKNKKFTKVVLEQMKYPIIIHLRLLVYMYKSSVKEEPEDLPNRIDELFSIEFFNTVEKLDVNCQAPVVKEQTWASYIYQECLQFSNAIESILIKYSHYLNYEMIKLIEDLNKTAFMEIVLSEGRLRRRTEDDVWRHEDNIFKKKFKNDENKEVPNSFFKNKLIDENNKHILKDHIDLFLEVIRIYNKHNPNNPIELDTQLWSKDIAPLYGDSRCSKESSLS